MRSVLALLLLSTLAGCSKQETPPKAWSDNRKSGESDPPKPSSSKSTPVLDNELVWASESFSPKPGSHPDPELDDLVELCGKNDSALSEVATEIARLWLVRETLPSLDEISFLLRKRGVPYVSPRLWTAAADGATLEMLEPELKKFGKSKSKRGVHYCGLGLATRDTHMTVVALDAESLVTVRPLPTQVKKTDRPSLELDFLEDASLAEVILLAPSGAPRHIHGTLRGRHFSAELRFFESGPYLVQVLGTLPGGPMPVASMMVSVDEDAPAYFQNRDVPGEKAYDEKLAASEALLALVNGAREESGLTPLRHNATLARVAEAHTKLMRDQKRISHDAGDDTPAVRVEAAGLKPRATGENVAQAPSVVRLHRALWSSPSHRENLLLARWNSVGISVLADEAGQLYATELFADLPQ